MHCSLRFVYFIEQRNAEEDEQEDESPFLAKERWLLISIENGARKRQPGEIIYSQPLCAANLCHFLVEQLQIAI